MASVKTASEIEKAARTAIEALYGTNITDFRVRVVFPFLSEGLITHGGLPTAENKDSWDVQVTFLLDKNQYTVDLIIQENNGQITYSRLIDKMVPL
jgi:hypothetical protein